MEFNVSTKPVDERTQATLENSSYIRTCLEDVHAFDQNHDVEHQSEDNLKNMVYHALCLAGEAGEVANAVKKIWRDGSTPERRDHVAEELVDCMIYMSELIITMGIPFDAAWEKKHKELYARWAAKKMSGGRKEEL